MFQSFSTTTIPVSYGVQINPLNWANIYLNSHNQEKKGQEKENQVFYLELDQK